jgi:type III restriction enzyme
MLFGGFTRCLYPIQKFDVDPERQFAVILETDAGVLKWVKPGKNQFRIYYRADQAYEPDFVVDTQSAKLVCEPKRASEMEDEDVLAKARAAVAWCERATEHERENGGKPWRYLLMPHDEIDVSCTVDGLIRRFERR